MSRTFVSFPKTVTINGKTHRLSDFTEEVWFGELITRVTPVGGWFKDEDVRGNIKDRVVEKSIKERPDISPCGSNGRIIRKRIKD